MSSPPYRSPGILGPSVTPVAAIAVPIERPPATSLGAGAADPGVAEGRVLLVDDEPFLLATLSRQIRGHFEVKAALDGEKALEVLHTAGPFAAIVADHRMPGIGGLELLERARSVAPGTQRILLCEPQDLAGALPALNGAHLFRVLTKPCDSQTLLAVLSDAAAVQRSERAERELADATLRGAVQALVDVLALVNPEQYVRATRVQRIAGVLAERLGASRWEVENAALLCRLGIVALPGPIVDKLSGGAVLSDAEQAAVDRLPVIADQLLAPVPRLDGVREIIRHHRKNLDGSGPPAGAPGGEAIPLGARVLRVAIDYDLVDARGLAPAMAVDLLRQRRGCYDDRVLTAMAGFNGPPRGAQVLEVPFSELRAGMVFADDVRTRPGLLLCSRGTEVTDKLLLRLAHFAPGSGLREPLRVVVPAGATPAAAESA